MLCHLRPDLIFIIWHTFWKRNPGTGTDLIHSTSLLICLNSPVRRNEGFVRIKSGSTSCIAFTVWVLCLGYNHPDRINQPYNKSLISLQCWQDNNSLAYRDTSLSPLHLSVWIQMSQARIGRNAVGVELHSPCWFPAGKSKRRGTVFFFIIN